MGIPNTTVRTSHAVSIRVAGITIGQIQTWNPTQSRPATPTYELNSITSGEVYENVPGNMSGLTVNVTRYDLFNKRMEQAWGPKFSIVMLSDQRNPFSVVEKWINPDGVVFTNIYQGCWFTSLGRTLSATGDRIVNVNASLVYTRIDEF